MKRRRPCRRSPLPFLLLAVAVAAVVSMEADSPGGQDQALPTPTLEEAKRDKLDAPAAATLTPMKWKMLPSGLSSLKMAPLYFWSLPGP